jgi:uncharacterized repeat protein (TIGR03809 family)
MSAIQGHTRFDEMSRKWLDLAERRLAHLTALYRSGRWQRYYDAERLAVLVRDAIESVRLWKQLAGRARAPAAGKKGPQPAE